MKALVLTALTLVATVTVASGLSAQYNNCVPPTSAGGAVGPLPALRGEMHLMVYATAGPGKGRIASGTLRLEEAPAALAASGVVLVGSSTIDLSRVGGRYAGSLRSRDPAAPGITLEGPSGTRAGVFTFGSIRTRDAAGALTVPVTRFELVERSRRGLRGVWRTMGGAGEAASGYFCMSRF